MKAASSVSFLTAALTLGLGLASGDGQTANPIPAAVTQEKSQMQAPVHVVNSFHFRVNASMPQVAPLFGPEGERKWAGKHWDPQFVYPQPGPVSASTQHPDALDIPGSVFTVQVGHLSAVWVATIFDPVAGRMQYVAFIPGHMASIVDVRLTATAQNKTAVEVTYTRTALDPAANEMVEAHGSQDAQSGPEWEQAIEASLKKTGETAR